MALAGIGVVLTVYLLIVHLMGASTLFCQQGSSCDIVQSSAWSTLFGLPVALWGLGLYALIALVAATGRSAAVRWRRLFPLSLIGVLVSVYLTLVGWIALEAFCVWCLISLALIIAIFVLVLRKRPAQTPAEGWKRWLTMHAIVLVPLMVLISAAQAGWLSPPDDPRLEPLAAHLSESGAKYYGAYWCPNCRKQKGLFGRAADGLPYVECTPNGRNGAVAFECAAQGIDSFPTWIIRGQRYNGLLTPDELARHSRFRQWNAPSAGDADK
ncbi:vitamin K epoxide reductase family protein [Xanthomonadaceae bacterium XH05]|nr:vitamin K epoxide reductase family protein [Xanthomonadaceae bacterium XH05]